MSEAANVRLVRCPKCSNLLPEVTDYSVYQCGGCGAVLRAKNNGVDLETFSEKSDEERVVGNVEKLSDRYEKMMSLSDQRRMMDMSDGSESDVRSNISSSGRAERQRMIRDRAEHNRSNLSNKESKWDAEPDPIHDRNFDNLQRAKFSQDLEDMVMLHEGLMRAQRTDPEMMGYGKEGPSSLVSRPVNVDDFNNFDYVGDDRAELLKRLDELKYQISRSGNLMEKGKEKVPLDRRMLQSDPYAYENVYNDAQFRNRPAYQNQYAEPTRLMQRQEMAGNGFYPPQYAPSPLIHPSRSQMLRRGQHEPPTGPTRYQIPPPHAYVSGPYVDDRMAYTDSAEPYPSDFNRHHPSCSCYQCCTKRRAPMYGDEYADVPSDGFYTRHDTPGSFGSRDYNQRIPNHPPPPPRPLRSRNAGPHTRWPSDVNSELDGFTRHQPPRVHLASGGKIFHPIAGGAPFLTCYNCFELLLLPKKLVVKNNSSRKKKIRCGVCATMIDFAFSDKKIVVSVDVEAEDNGNPIKADSKCGIPPNLVRTTFSSEDYDNSGYDFLSMDRNSKLEADEDTEAEAERKDATSADTSANNKGPPPPSGSSLQDYFEYSNIHNRSREENKVEPNKLAPRHVQGKESSATEIDLSSNEYSNTGTTFDSGEGSRDGDRLKSGRVAESFFAGIIKKSFKDSSNRSNENFEHEKTSVTVNGHLIPDRLIKKAEKLAGTIHPGHYWYDFRAGFWGVVGGPCLGIIPPFIEEFNYPMPEHSAGGNTHVFVNGRELHQKDLNLLGSRGLPTERDRSYIVEMSGRVLDEDTGEELPGLGKLAPTVERLKHGFGMKAPKAAA